MLCEYLNELDNIDIDYVLSLIEVQDFDDIYPGFSNQNHDGEYIFESRDEAVDRINHVVEIFKKLSDPCLVYRSIVVSDENSINLRRPGKHWSMYRQSAINFGRHNDSTYLITGKVDKSNINWSLSIANHFTFSGMGSEYDEHELIVNDDDKIEIVKIEPLTDVVINLNKYHTT
jgi:hypothetical protein